MHRSAKPKPPPKRYAGAFRQGVALLVLPDAESLGHAQVALQNEADEVEKELARCPHDKSAALRLGRLDRVLDWLDGVTRTALAASQLPGEPDRVARDLPVWSVELEGVDHEQRTKRVSYTVAAANEHEAADVAQRRGERRYDIMRPRAVRVAPHLKAPSEQACRLCQGYAQPPVRARLGGGEVIVCLHCSERYRPQLVAAAKARSAGEVH